MSSLLWNSGRQLPSLRWQWVILSLASLVLLWFSFRLIRTGWEAEYALRWLFQSALVSIYPLVTLWRGLPQNLRSGGSQLLPWLGIGNTLTVLRGILIAALAGFLFLPQPVGWLIWLPGLIYTAVTVVDCIDGYLARKLDQVTRLGAMLDMSLDGLGVLVGVLLLIQYGQVPAWIILVGLARYLFLLGIYIRTRMGKPIYELAENPIRRQFAGAQMGFIGIVLFPVFSPPGTHLAATLFAVPFLFGFAKDYLIASGVISSGVGDVIRQGSNMSGNLLHSGDLNNALTRLWRQARWMPFVLRLITSALVFWWLSRMNPVSTPETFLTFTLATGGAILLLLGAAGRLAALLLLFSIGVSQSMFGLSTLQIWLVFAATALYFVGTGPFSLWVPERSLLLRRPGEK